MAPQHTSSFLHPGAVAHANTLAVLHLKRDLLTPVILEDRDDRNEGYAEGKVTNTRFGSFPHSTLIGLPWGSQVRASTVDTGSRGRKGANSKTDRVVKRKRSEEPDAEFQEAPSTTKPATAAATGFLHLLPPTVESWTISLPHRTQVVYTPDYSYVLHRLKARPGSVIIEAGAGSGSFTHAAARAVFNGYRSAQESSSRKRRRVGKVWSYEFHEQRVEKLKTEIKEHGLESIVQITHRDVCRDGFLVPQEQRFSNGETFEEASPAIGPQADAIFLDLPAPWYALHVLK